MNHKCSARKNNNTRPRMTSSTRRSGRIDAARGISEERESCDTERERKQLKDREEVDRYTDSRLRKLNYPDEGVAETGVGDLRTLRAADETNGGQRRVLETPGKPSN
ncbi:hypothetical protein EYF80_065529 [Liparis tanakae]|uniref:Uncharacterized protein n=1 Tax=Liparis tanakae TaxID=230148 RepID=A0A4Z2E6G6_9TELE|nr:hypothetical protein EYF80_065529 [Liparis tanakae]